MTAACPSLPPLSSNAPFPPCLVLRLFVQPHACTAMLDCLGEKLGLQVRGHGPTCFAPSSLFTFHFIIMGYKRHCKKLSTQRGEKRGGGEGGRWVLMSILGLHTLSLFLSSSSLGLTKCSSDTNRPPQEKNCAAKSGL